jgi:hypothetical protein
MQPLWHGTHDFQPREMQFVNQVLGADGTEE